MAIKVKAIERNVSFEKGQEKFAYVLQADLYSKLSDAKVIQEAALRSSTKIIAQAIKFIEFTLVKKSCPLQQN